VNTAVDSKNTLCFQRAFDAFLKGKYQEALGLYEEAGRLFGPALVKGNIQLCRNRLASLSSTPAAKPPDRADTPPASKPVPDTLAMAELKLELRRKDRLLRERYRELALLTALLESRDCSPGH